MGEELNPCPMCGDPLEIVHRNGGKYVRCITCIFETARHGYHVSDDELKRRCNRRPAEDALKAENDRMKIKADRAETWLDVLSDMLQKIITVTSSENSKKLDPEETVKWINGRARYAIEVMNKVYGCGKDNNAPTNAPDTEEGGRG